MDIKALKEPLDPSHIKTREQAGRPLAYIEGWHAISEANRIFGFNKWSRSLVRLEETNRALVDIKSRRGDYQQWRVGYLAVVRVTVEVNSDCTIIREGTGFGMGMAKPDALGDAIESAIKEAETDAMKRALVTFGNPFGLALYDKDKRNVAAEPAPEPEPQPDPDTSREIAKSMKFYIDNCKTRADLMGLVEGDWYRGERAKLTTVDFEDVRGYGRIADAKLKAAEQPPIRIEADDNAGIYA